MCYKEIYDGYTFPDARVGETVDSEEFCDKNKVHYLLPRATRTCDGDGFSAAKWNTPVMTDCGNDVTTEQQLERINMINVTIDNVEDVSNNVQDITSNTEGITVEALEYTAEILTEILQTNSNSSE
ncbi:uncharacterized protein LOC117123351, partial [Anneissia japonica]|uniref:uncharacterized protein LOC117123351 n=1 Tax=Anneissia japonica TaxID=1529436 RepID=UPI0014256335